MQPWSLGLPRMNVSGTLLEGIGLWGEFARNRNKGRAGRPRLRYCDLAVTQGPTVHPQPRRYQRSKTGDRRGNDRGPRKGGAHTSTSTGRLPTGRILSRDRWRQLN